MHSNLSLKVKFLFPPYHQLHKFYCAIVRQSYLTSHEKLLCKLFHFFFTICFSQFCRLMQKFTCIFQSADTYLASTVLKIPKTFFNADSISKNFMYMIYLSTKFEAICTKSILFQLRKFMKLSSNMTGKRRPVNIDFKSRKRFTRLLV